MLAPTLGAPARPGGLDAVGWAIAVAGEVFIGLAIGFVAMLVVAAADAAGELIGFEMGLSIGVVFNPSTGGQEGLVTRLLNTLALLLFLAVNGHHLLIRAVAVSFERLRPGAALEPRDGGGHGVARRASCWSPASPSPRPSSACSSCSTSPSACSGAWCRRATCSSSGCRSSIGLGLLALYEALPG